MTRNSLAIGDYNLNDTQVRALAEQIGGRLVMGRGVDHGILTGDDVRLVGVRRNLPRYGSDHGPILVDLDIEWDNLELLERVRVLWWNVYVGQHPDTVLRAVCELVDEHQPHVVALGETYRCRGVLGRVPGYRRHQGHRGEAVAMTVLVRRDVEVRSRGWLNMRRDWIGPVHDKLHGPRSFPRLRLRFKHGAELRLLAVHFPTGGHDGRNRAAVLEAAKRVKRWGRRRVR